MSDQFTPQARKLWGDIPMKYQTRILNNVWCGGCMKATTIVNFTGQVEGGMLILKGKCERCGHPVARVIENE